MQRYRQQPRIQALRASVESNQRSVNGTLAAFHSKVLRVDEDRITNRSDTPACDEHCRQAARSVIVDAIHIQRTPPRRSALSPPIRVRPFLLAIGFRSVGHIQPSSSVPRHVCPQDEPNTTRPVWIALASMMVRFPTRLVSRRRLTGARRRISYVLRPRDSMASSRGVPRAHHALSEVSVSVPADRKYLKSHEWHKLEPLPRGECVPGDDSASKETSTNITSPCGSTAAVLIGITQHAADELTDVTFVDLPKVGARLAAGKPFGVIESVKATSDLMCGVDGEVAEINTSLNDHPELVNQDPFGRGWMIKVRPANPSQLDGLLTAADYAKQLGQ